MHTKGPKEPELRSQVTKVKAQLLAAAGPWASHEEQVQRGPRSCSPHPAHLLRGLNETLIALIAR